MTPLCVLFLLRLLYLQALRSALALGVPRDLLADDICDLARRCGAVLDGARA